MIKVATHQFGYREFPNANTYNIDLDSGLLSIYTDSSAQSQDKALARFAHNTWAFVERVDD